MTVSNLDKNSSHGGLPSEKVTIGLGMAISIQMIKQLCLLIMPTTMIFQLLYYKIQRQIQYRTNTLLSINQQIQDKIKDQQAQSYGYLYASPFDNQDHFRYLLIIYLRNKDMRHQLYLITLLLFSYLAISLTPGTVAQNNLLSFPITYMGAVQNTKLVLDSNWHWIHSASDSSQNCFDGNSWNPNLCPDPKACWNSCAIQGIPSDQWTNTYGIKTEGDKVTLKYVTRHQYGENIGSRVYLMDSIGQNYMGINMLGKEMSFEADMNNAGCGLNGAMYFVEIPLNGGPNLNNGNAASFGLGYCDAQCTTVKFIQGQAQGIKGFYSAGACCAQFDIWESNYEATQMTSHVCKKPGLSVCQNDTECGRGNGNRYKGQCDMDGADHNPFRTGQHNLFGKGSNFKIDTSRPFTVKTKFITDNGEQTGNLIEVKRTYVQDGKTIDGGSLTDQSIAKQKAQFGEVNYHEQLGGLKAMGQAFKRKMGLVISFWDDESPARMLWLDGVFPIGSSQPGTKRGPCPQDSGYPQKMRNQVPDSHVIYSNIKIDKISKEKEVSFLSILAEWLYELLTAVSQ